MVTIRIFNADTTRPLVEVVLRKGCGTAEIAGAFLLTGDARLEDPNLHPDQQYGLGGAVRIVTHTDPQLADSDVQQITFVLPVTSACPEGVEPDQFGSIYMLSGWWAKAVVETTGPTASATGPVLRNGDFLDLDVVKANADLFDRTDTAFGLWGGNDFGATIRPSPGLDDEIIGSPPGFVTAHPLTWEGRDGLRARATWRESGSADRRATRLFFFGLLAGLGGSAFVSGLLAVATANRTRSTKT